MDTHKERQNGNGVSNGNGAESQREIVISKTVEQLCNPESYHGVIHKTAHEVPMPSVETLKEALEILRTILFPGYFGPSDLKGKTMRYYVGASLDHLFEILSEQIKRGFCFACGDSGNEKCGRCEENSLELTCRFIAQIPDIRRLLSTDVQAAYAGDPAAKQPGETIFCYPSIYALTNHRIAHELSKLGIELIPRIISEMAHSVTGIDIHPGAQIGESFFIDHGTGVVIGETSIIGKNVRLYQGVTLGAKSFPVDANGKPIKGIPRHPIVEDDVIIYSNATVLGRITVGKGSIIGGNVWVTSDVPPGSRVMQNR